ncbi:MAG: hypothetical protein QOE75_1877 [Solirubrobacterales bacterium]|jgi:hypothetical protein|nr:hypothetical protein [Solirubrobacterales bacterium]
MAASEATSRAGLELTTEAGVALLRLGDENGPAVLDEPTAAAIAEAGADLEQIAANTGEQNLDYNRRLRDATDAVAALPEIDEANARTERRLAEPLGSADRVEGARAFLGRREPRFEGR